MLSHADSILRPLPHARGILGWIPPVPGAAAGVYGPAMNIDTKSNMQIGWTNSAVLSFRFRSTTTTTVTGIIYQLRRGSVYSAGNGGKIELSIQADDGTANHFPSGIKLATVTRTPTNSPTGGFEVYDAFSSPPTITPGLWHVVFTNTDASQTVNYVSINMVYTYSAITPRQPSYPDTDLASLYKDPTWHTLRETPIFDVVCADGSHYGQGYVQAYVSSVAQITGANWLRQRFTVTGGTFTTQKLWTRFGRQTTGTGLVTYAAYTGAGALIEQGNVDCSACQSYTLGADAASGTWKALTFSVPRTFTNGQSYWVQWSTASSNAYSLTPILRRDSSDDGVHFIQSRQFTDGASGERSTNSGGSWSTWYTGFANDFQWYFETV